MCVRCLVSLAHIFVTKTQTMVIVSGGQRDSMPDVVEHSEERQEMSSGWNEKLERRLLELEENNIKLEALLEQERNRRVRHWAKRTQTQARMCYVCINQFMDIKIFFL